MMKKTRYKVFSAQISTIYSTLMLTGLGLLILTLILLLKMYEVEPINSQNGNLVFIFMIIFAVSGFILIISGFFGAIKMMMTMKKNFPKLLEEASFTEKTALSGGSGLQIIRPGKQTSVEEKITKQQDTSAKSSTEKLAKKSIETIKPQVEKVKTASKSVPSEIPSDFSYNDGLQNIVDRYNSEKVRKAFKNWYNTLMITFPDISKSFLFIIDGEEGLDFSEGVDENAAVQVNMDSTIFVKMMTKQINPIKAYSSGNLEVKGEMKNMLKLRKLMF